MTKKEHAKKFLSAVVAILLTVPEERFDLSEWGSTYVVKPCGFSGCAMGWCATTPSFVKEFGLGHDGTCPVYDDGGTVYSGFEAVREAMGLKVRRGHSQVVGLEYYLFSNDCYTSAYDADGDSLLHVPISDVVGRINSVLQLLESGLPMKGDIGKDYYSEVLQTSPLFYASAGNFANGLYRLTLLDLEHILS